MKEIPRRDFLRGLGSSLVTSAAGLSALESLVPLRAADAAVTPQTVRYLPEMEQVVSWMESTPRERIFDAAVDELKKGLPYRKLLGGLFLAGIRNIKPRPVGFKFHAVMVINSAHQLALDAPQSDRLLPFFWALDNFKSSQDQDVKEGDWSLGPVKESAVPPPSRARQAFVEAMDRWDEEAADAAVAGLCRAAGAAEVMELMWPYGARDWQNIGHKIIFTAQSYRTLQTIGWQHAEPVLRSLVYGLLTGGASETAAPYQSNRELAGKVRADWAAGRPDEAAARSLLAAMRKAGPDDAAREAVDILNRGVAASSIWDAVMLAAGDLLMRAPGILSLHAATAANSLHYAFSASGRDATRLLALLQAVAWIPLYREGIRGRGTLPEGPRIEELEAGEHPPKEVAEIFQTASRDRLQAARGALAYASGGRETGPFFDAARHLVFVKGTDSHDYKFAAAAFEELLAANGDWRPRLLASSMYYLKGAGGPDSPLAERARQAIARVEPRLRAI